MWGHCLEHDWHQAILLKLVTHIHLKLPNNNKKIITYGRCKTSLRRTSWCSRRWSPPTAGDTPPDGSRTPPYRWYWVLRAPSKSWVSEEVLVYIFIGTWGLKSDQSVWGASELSYFLLKRDNKGYLFHSHLEALAFGGNFVKNIETNNPYWATLVNALFSQANMTFERHNLFPFIEYSFISFYPFLN